MRDRGLTKRYEIEDEGEDMLDYVGRCRALGKLVFRG